MRAIVSFGPPSSAPRIEFCVANISLLAVSALVPSKRSTNFTVSVWPVIFSPSKLISAPALPRVMV
ncbi:hypothetical protein D3C81_2286630 [compost metagenome]